MAAQAQDDGPPFEAGTAKPNGGAPGAGEQQTSGDAQGKNRGTFHAGPRPGADWPEPGVLGEPAPAPEFPTWLLPRVMRQWVEAQAENMGIPASMLAVPLLVCVAGAIGRDLVLQVKHNDPSWTERCCMWSMLILPPGNLKSAAIKEATRPLRLAEARQRERWKMDVQAWELRQKLDSKGKIKPDKDDPKPFEPKLVVSDTTIEAVADAMVESHGLTLIRDELSGWIGNMSRYSKGSDRPFFLECHSGGTYTIDRVIRGRFIVPALFLCIVGGIQPRVAKTAFKGNLTGEDDGFFVRFGLPCYPDPIPWDGVKDVPPERDLRRALMDAVQGLADADWGNLLAGELLRLDAGARSRFFTWYDGHMRERVRLHEDRQDHGFMAKGDGLVLRIAIALHAFRWKCGEVHEVRLVDQDSVDAAIGMLEAFCLPMYARIYGAFGQVQSHDAAQRVLALIKRKKLTKIRVADIAKLQWKGMRERAPILAALEALEDVDVLRRSAPAPGARVGRPSDHWIVSPKVHA